MTRYSSGADFEREIIQILKSHGYDCVRGAGSKGKLAGLDVDIVASKNTGQTRYELGIVLIQAKRTKLKRRVKAAGLIA